MISAFHGSKLPAPRKKWRIYAILYGSFGVVPSESLMELILPPSIVGGGSSGLAAGFIDAFEIRGDVVFSYFPCMVSHHLCDGDFIKTRDDVSY